MSIILICTPLRFYSERDEDFFFAWLAEIECVSGIKGIGRELHVKIESEEIPEKDLKELFGLFRRYGMQTDQLDVFAGEDKELLQWCRNGLHENVYPAKQVDHGE